MKGQCKGRYGLSSEEVMIMKSKLFKARKHGSTDWADLDEFCKWAVGVGYKPGMRLRKHNTELPHSIKNSYFAEPGRGEPERHETFIDAESPFCQQCTNFDCNIVPFGCKKWRNYFIKNWNEHIHRKQPVQKRTQVFRYEHPDLVREGIVWR